MNKNILGAAGLLTVGLVAGGAFAITGANAADEPATTTTPTSSISPIVTPLVFTPGELDDEDESDEVTYAADGSVITADLDDEDELDDDEGDLDDSDDADEVDEDLDTELDD